METQQATNDPSPYRSYPGGLRARRALEEDARTQRRLKRGDTEAQVRRGRDLLEVRASDQFPDEHFDRFEDWTKSGLGYGQRYRDRLLAAGRVDPALVHDKIIAIQKVAAVGSQPEWLHRTLLELDPKTSVPNLTLAGASAVEHKKRHGDEAAALEHARAVVAGTEKALVQPRRDTELTLVTRIRRTILVFLAACEKLQGQVGGKPLPEGSPEKRILLGILHSAWPMLLTLLSLVGLKPWDMPGGVGPAGLRPEGQAADSPGGLRPDGAPERREYDRQGGGPAPPEDPAPDSPSGLTPEPRPTPPEAKPESKPESKIDSPSGLTPEPQPTAPEPQPTPPESQAAPHAAPVTQPVAPVAPVAPPPPAPPTEQELYERQVWGAVNLVLAWIHEEEKLPLQQILTMTIAGQEPYHLTQFVRVIFERAEDAGVAEEALEDLNEWLRLAARPDLHKRWGDVFNFFYFAELPEFEEHLFFLRGADLSELNQDELESLRRLFDLYPDKLPPPVPVPEGTTAQEWAPHARDIQRRRWLIRKAYWWFDKYQGQMVSAQAMGIFWVALRKYLDRLEAQDRRYRELLGDDDFPKLPPWNWEED